MARIVKNRAAGWICVMMACLGGIWDCAWADVVLELPQKIVMVAENGKNTNLEGRVHLPDGINQIAVQFQGELKRGRYDNEGDMGYSDVFVIKFKALNQELEMMIPRITSALDLEQFNRTGDISLREGKGKTIGIQVEKLEKEGIQLFRDYAKEIEAFNRTDPPTEKITSPAKSQMTRAHPQSHKVMQQNFQSPASSEHMAEKMLKYWYQQADEAARQRFRHWINQME